MRRGSVSVSASPKITTTRCSRSIEGKGVRENKQWTSTDQLPAAGSTYEKVVHCGGGDSVNAV